MIFIETGVVRVQITVQTENSNDLAGKGINAQSRTEDLTAHGGPYFLPHRFMGCWGQHSPPRIAFVVLLIERHEGV